MKKVSIILALGALSLAACVDTTQKDKTVDRQFGKVKHLSELKAGIWVDPNGCDHWIIDDGAEGYLSQRLDKHGKPVCSGIAPPETAVGPFKSGGDIEDSI